MSLSLTKVGGVAFATGLMIAVSIEVLGRCLDAAHVHLGMWLSTVVLWLWPTGVVLIETSANRAGYILFFISAVCNGLLYALAAILLYCFARSVRNDW